MKERRRFSRFREKWKWNAMEETRSPTEALIFLWLPKKMAKLIIPKKLKKGDTIAFVSPSAGLAPFAGHRIEKARSFFEKNGYQVKIAKNALRNSGYVSAPAKDRAQDLNEVFLDEDVKCIISTVGGNHSNQVLPYLDWKIIKNNPKIFVGYSDISVLHYAFQTQANLQTYYGPCVMTQFGESPEVFDYTWKYFQMALSDDLKKIRVAPSKFWTDDCSRDWSKGEDLQKARKLNKNQGFFWLKEGRAQGRIVGGCVPSINHLLGTKFWIDPKDGIFFIDIPEGQQFNKGLSLSEVGSYLADLYNVGVFDAIKGLIIGRPFGYSQDDFKALADIILNQYAKGNDYPILAQANIGHADPIITIPYGSEAFLDSNRKIFEIEN